MPWAVESDVEPKTSTYDVHIFIYVVGATVAEW